jgi:hypothetical protein
MKRAKKTEVRRVPVVETFTEIDHLAGTGVLSMPILADILPTYFHQEMERIQKFFVLIDGSKYRVDQSIWEKAQQEGAVDVEYWLKDQSIERIF